MFPFDLQAQLSENIRNIIVFWTISLRWVPFLCAPLLPPDPRGICRKMCAWKLCSQEGSLLWTRSRGGSGRGSHQQLCCKTVWRSSQCALMYGRGFPLETRQLLWTSPVRIRISIETQILALQEKGKLRVIQDLCADLHWKSGLGQNLINTDLFKNKFSGWYLYQQEGQCDGVI